MSFTFSYVIIILFTGGVGFFCFLFFTVYASNSVLACLLAFTVTFEPLFSSEPLLRMAAIKSTKDPLLLMALVLLA